MELEDAVRLLNLAIPLFQHRLKVYDSGTGITSEVSSITVFRNPEGTPEIHVEIQERSFSVSPPTVSPPCVCNTRRYIFLCRCYQYFDNFTRTNFSCMIICILAQKARLAPYLKTHERRLQFCSKRMNTPAWILQK